MTYNVCGYEYSTSRQITDHVGEGRVWHPVTHWKEDSFDELQVVAVHKDPLSNRTKTWYNSGLAGFPFPRYELVDSIGNTVPWDDMYQDLLREASGAFPASTTLAVNIAELADVKKLGLSMMKLIRGLGSALSPRKLGKRTFKDLSGRYLEYIFGIKPLLSDVRDFFDIRGAIKEKMDRLYSIGQYEHIRVRGVSPGKTITVPVHYIHPVGGGCAAEGEYSLSVRDVGILSGWASRDLMDERSAFIRLLIGRLGLNNPALITWELIPFSFVIDWFIPVGSWIERASGTWNNYIGGVVKQRARIDRLQWSLKREFDVTCTGHLVGTTQTWILKEAPEYGGRYEYTYYTRGSGCPLTRPPAPPSNWSFDKSLTATALVLQRVL